MSHLLPAVHAAYASGRYLSPSMAEIAARTAPHRPDAHAHAALSKRELEVVRMFVSGLTVTEIATLLHRSKKTISTQKGSAMTKLGILRDMDLVRYGMEMGLTNTSAAPVPPGLPVVF
ncbi:Transcriptional regulatory protein RcsB [compost metagenome]